MFTGIIEDTGIIQQVIKEATNKTFWIKSSLAPLLKVDQSLNHSGVCLTVEEINDDIYRVTAIHETLEKTNILSWEKGSIVNLERSMQMNGRFDGHIVQGHVDCRGKCLDVHDTSGSWQYDIKIEKKFSGLIIEKGSVTLNGISLTIFNVTEEKFAVAIIPYTHEHTNMRQLKKGDTVNIEFDIIGKYVQRLLTKTQHQ